MVDFVFADAAACGLGFGVLGPDVVGVAGLVDLAVGGVIWSRRHVDGSCRLSGVVMGACGVRSSWVYIAKYTLGMLLSRRKKFAPCLRRNFYPAGARQQTQPVVLGDCGRVQVR